MIEITSKDNEKIKYLKKLGLKKYRDKESQFLVENLNIIFDGINFGVLPKSVFVTQRFIDKNINKASDILSRVTDVYLIDENVNNSFSSLETPAGICAVYDKQSKDINFDESIIYLNGINDPGNLGTILRSGVAFAIKNFVLDEKCADLYNPKTISAAKDAIFKLNISFDKDLELLAKIKKEMKVYSTSMSAKKNIDDIDFGDKICLVLGSEAYGISRDVEELSSEQVKINMSGDIESLNVAISAGIIFHVMYKKNILAY